MIFAAGFTQFFSQIQQANQSTSGSKWRSGDNVLCCWKFSESHRAMDVTFDTFWSCVFFIFVGRSGSGICNITSLILCRFPWEERNWSQVSQIHTFVPMRSRKLWLYDMYGTNILIASESNVNSSSHSAHWLWAKNLLAKGVWAVLETWVFWKGKKQQNLQERSFLFPRHPKYLLRRSILGIFLWSKILSQQVFGVFGCLGYWSRLVFFNGEVSFDVYSTYCASWNENSTMPLAMP